MTPIIQTTIRVFALSAALRCLGAPEEPSNSSPVSEKEESLNPIVTTASDLIANPEKFSGSYVRVTGYWLVEFEYSGLHSSPTFGAASPIWVDSWSRIPGRKRQVKDPQANHAALEAAYKETGIIRYLPQQVLRVTLEGYFDHNPSRSGFGHMGQYPSLLTVERVVEVKVLSVHLNRSPK